MIAKDYFEEQFKTILQKLYSDRNTLHESVLYSALSSGKRIRAQLCLLLCEQFGGKFSDAIVAASAVEMVHAYSLIHDDLPCMDNDDWRRGRPTNHKIYGEAQALLAGDTLLTDSFRVLSDPDVFYSNIGSEFRLSMIQELSSAIGGSGMVLGQSLDMVNINHKKLDETAIDDIHINKTAKLIGASCALGALSARADFDCVKRARDFGLSIGLAFQIQDDLLDQLQGTGKSVGKDADQGKVTYATLLGQKGSLERVKFLIEKAKSSIKPVDSSLEHFIEALLARKY